MPRRPESCSWTTAERAVLSKIYDKELKALDRFRRTLANNTFLDSPLLLLDGDLDRLDVL
jgi:hypothetical protein